MGKPKAPTTFLTNLDLSSGSSPLKPKSILISLWAFHHMFFFTSGDDDGGNGDERGIVGGPRSWSKLPTLHAASPPRRAYALPPSPCWTCPAAACTAANLSRPPPPRPLLYPSLALLQGNVIGTFLIYHCILASKRCQAEVHLETPSHQAAPSRTGDILA